MKRRSPIVTWPMALALLTGVGAVPSARGDIFQWEYVNPADPAQGKRQGVSLAPGGAGVNAAPWADLDDRDLRRAFLAGADLTSASLQTTNLTDAELAGAKLKFANFGAADLTRASLDRTDLSGADAVVTTFTGASLAGADVRGGRFSAPFVAGSGRSFGISADQLYSTASYRMHDLSGIFLGTGDLRGWNFTGQNLTAASFHETELNGANFNGADLTGAIFDLSDLRGASLAGAEVRGADFNSDNNWGPDFGGGSGLTPEQLYATASYKSGDLSGIGLYGSDLTGANFAGQKMVGVNFGFGEPATANPWWIGSARLAGADFRGADLTDAMFYESDLTGTDFRGATLKDAEFSETDLTGAKLSGLDLREGSFAYATMTGADLSGADVRGAGFGRDYLEFPFRKHVGGITPAQLYSTASYQALDLRGIRLDGNLLAGVNLAGQYLADADFSGADLAGADLSGADARGAQGLDSAVAANLIEPDGRIAGLDLTSGAVLVVRDYDGPDPSGSEAPMPIRVEQRLTMDARGTLRLVFEEDGWGSTIGFAPGIPVALGGALELTFATGIDAGAQVGRTIDVFDWEGTTPIGAFNVISPYAWDVSELYTTGQVTLTAVPEPSAVVLLAAVGLMALRRTRWRARE